MTYSLLSICAVLVAITSGCRSVKPVVDNDKDYIFKAFFIEGDSNRVRELFPSVDKICSSEVFETGLNTSRKSRKISVTAFPVVYLDLGEERTIDRQEYREFPDGYDEEGKVTSFSNSGIGKKVRVHLKEMKDGSAELDFAVSNREFLGWDTTFANEKGDFRTPLFESRELRSGVTLMPGECIILGGSADKKSKKSLLMAVQFLASRSKSNKDAHEPADAGHGM